ncbi:hypothetical protein CROQUDRAFT_133178 [Cronartium quercuum f. sp. fusiforme G11]|uniref:BPL/LPL catalytic domain-containing protein n=1 Tax=Cronartium quercuum f. sp. fusiforme G11 TaxID=708437 RepID=A0A9P6TD55_9BASI|nr:hypothetical protein CROQUDRAFT_133178 [Cronartium quercuum f. sp. fusiforme G11]
MRPPTMNVLVYSGPGIPSTTVNGTQKILKQLLSNAYDVLLAPPQMVLQQPWMDSSSLFVIPGGNRQDIVEGLGPSGIDRIRHWVFGGGRYLGLGQGAQFAASPPLGSTQDLHQWMSLCSVSCNALEPEPDDSRTEKQTQRWRISTEQASWEDHWTSALSSIDIPIGSTSTFAGFFPESDSLSSQTTILARYENESKSLASAVRCPFGQGQAILLGFELHSDSSTCPLISQPHNGTHDEHTEWMRQLISLMGLKVSRVANKLTLSPTPQFLLSRDPNKLHRVATQLKTLFGSEQVLLDTQDRFRLHANQTELSHFSLESDKESRHLIIVSDHSSRPDLAPSFDWSAYFQAWSGFSSDTGTWPEPKMGDVILCAETVTSTQSLLEKNPKLISGLPHGLVFIATNQLSGRGRGKNCWISSPGCSQFSLLLKLDKSQGSGVVLLQYLFGLAVVESIRSRPGYEDLPIRLKWPNDLYGSLNAKDNSEDVKNYRKLGGILVNGSFNLHECVMIIGCGVNTSNAEPSASLNEVIRIYNQANEHAELRELTSEDLIAGIMISFSSMLEEFMIKGFKPFEKKYLSKWLHSDQIVTLDESGEKVRIVGITLDHGLLRTKRVFMNSSGNWVEDGTMIDLQPNSNSFDMLSGLIKAKS